MTMQKRATLAALALAGLFALQNCAVLNDMTAALANLQRLRFKLGEVHGFRLAGIEIGGKTRLGQFNAMDALALLNTFRTKKLPAEFTLDVLAVNPNDGTGGTRSTTSTLTSLECRFLIDDHPTVTGNIDQPIEIPGTGQESIGGANRTATRLALDAQPTVSTPFGPMTYPGRLTIVSKEFR
jgi:hypothetical protein